MLSYTSHSDKTFSSFKFLSVSVLYLVHILQVLYNTTCIYSDTISGNFLGSTVKDAVITVPAYFNDSQRQVSYSY